MWEVVPQAGVFGKGGNLEDATDLLLCITAVLECVERKSEWCNVLHGPKIKSGQKFDRLCFSKLQWARNTDTGTSVGLMLVM